MCPHPPHSSRKNTFRSNEKIEKTHTSKHYGCLKGRKERFLVLSIEQNTSICCHTFPSAHHTSSPHAHSIVFIWRWQQTQVVPPASLFPVLHDPPPRTDSFAQRQSPAWSSVQSWSCRVPARDSPTPSTYAAPRDPCETPPPPSSSSLAPPPANHRSEQTNNVTIDNTHSINHLLTSFMRLKYSAFLSLATESALLLFADDDEE